ncbi:MAG: hypothetical protein KIT09_34905 [Bryobacteraceae bacterium]|nr:hypothetical protein [Bryobacteraceae bacterium]
MKRAWRLIPGALFLILYWPGLWIWFMQDDFAWLSLNLRLEEGTRLWPLLLQPSQHGTLRPLSERAFFLGFYQLFGLNAVPFRVLIYATQLANLVLLALVVRRLTGARHAAFWAPIFWFVNTAVAGTLSWTCAYNQILCGFFILAAFFCLLKYVETARTRYKVLEWAAFLLGFSALEINLVYPMIAAVYCWFCARPRLRATLPMFAVSIAYVAANRLLVPKAAEGPYSMHFDAALPVTFAKYWLWSFGGMGLDRMLQDPWWNRVGLAGAVLLTAALLAFAVWKLRRRRWTAAVLALWFPIVVSPVLPLRDHFTEYYLTLPTIGIAMLGAWAFSEAWKVGPLLRVAAVVLAAIYLVPSAALTRSIVGWNLERSQAVRMFVLGVGRAQQLHPGKIVLLDNLSPDLFWSAMRDKPFPLVGARQVYLTPESENSIPPRPELAVVSDFILPPGPMVKALSARRAVVYDAGEPVLRNITTLYHYAALAKWKDVVGRRLDVGDPLFADQVGDGWYPIEGGYRWMKPRARVRLGGPRYPHEKLFLTGYASSAQLQAGPIRLSVAADGLALGAVLLTRGDAQFDAAFSLPPNMVGAESVEVEVSVDRAFVAPDEQRPVGAAFGVFAIR